MPYTYLLWYVQRAAGRGRDVAESGCSLMTVRCEKKR